MKWWRRQRAQRAYLKWLMAIPVEPMPHIDYSVCDWAPNDLLFCGTCGGEGAILLRTDWEMGDIIVSCVRCRQTGLDPIQCPDWAVGVA